LRVPLIYFLSFLILIFIPNAQAETITLKNGTVIEGKIVEKDGEKIKAEASGVTLTYYFDELASIDGIKPAEFVSSVPQQIKTNLPPSMTPVLAPPAADTPSAAPVSQLSGMSKKDLILKFIDVFGTRESLARNFEQLIKRSSPQQAADLEKAVNVDELIQQLIPLYDKYFTEQELIFYINFYSSPEGKKFLLTIPILMEQSVGISVKYFKDKLPAAPRKEFAAP
jgi:hypothetical protein